MQAASTVFLGSREEMLPLHLCKREMLSLAQLFSGSQRSLLCMPTSICMHGKKYILDNPCQFSFNMYGAGAIWFARWGEKHYTFFSIAFPSSVRRCFLLTVTHLVTNENCQALKSNDF